MGLSSRWTWSETGYTTCTSISSVIHILPVSCSFSYKSFVSCCRRLPSVPCGLKCSFNGRFFLLPMAGSLPPPVLVLVYGLSLLFTYSTHELSLLGLTPFQSSLVTISNNFLSRSTLALLIWSVFSLSFGPSTLNHLSLVGCLNVLFNFKL